MVHGVIQCDSGLDTLLAHNRQRQLMLHQRLVSMRDLMIGHRFGLTPADISLAGFGAS
jgi:hypothetical protein